MGKQRTPQGQRPGRRVPVRRVPAGTAGLAAPVAAEAPSEAIMEAEAEMNQDSAEPNAPQAEAETPEASTAAAEAPAAEAEPEARPEAVEEASEPEAAPEAAAAAPEEPAAEAAASDEARAGVPALEAALSDPLLPVAAVPAEVRSERPAQARSAFRFAFAPARLDVEGIGVVLANYVHNESVAAFSHMRALSAARSPAELIRLNVTEMQRAADASLTCWSDIARRATRGVPLH